jgi:hypothetical protein
VAGRIWISATAKGWLVHGYGRGGFRQEAPGPDVYREAELENVSGYGLDLGAVAEPLPRLRVGAAVSNLVGGSWRPARGPRVRTVSVQAGPDGGMEVSEETTPYLGSDDDGSEEARMGQALWRGTRFPAVLRAGASVEMGAGTLSAATSTTLVIGGLDPRWDAVPRTLAWSGAGRLPIRASYGWGSGARQLAVGLHLGGCRREWDVAASRRSGPWGSVAGASVSLTTGSAGRCGLLRP